MKRFNWRKSFSVPDAFAVIDTQRGRRHVAICLTGESASGLAATLNLLKPVWTATASATGRVTIIATAESPYGLASAAWHVRASEAQHMTAEQFACAVSIIEDRLYAVVANEHARQQ